MRLLLYTILLLIFGLSCYGIGHRDGSRSPKLVLDYAAGFTAGRNHLLREIACWDEATALSVSAVSHRVRI